MIFSLNDKRETRWFNIPASFYFYQGFHNHLITSLISWFVVLNSSHCDQTQTGLHLRLETGILIIRMKIFCFHSFVSVTLNVSDASTGSFSFSVLSGKVMFRDVYFINQDMSIRWADLCRPVCFSSCAPIISEPAYWLVLCLCYRIQDGFLIFRWWKMYNPKQKQHGEWRFVLIGA